MPRLPSWAVFDAFWQRVEPLLPQPTRDPNKSYIRKKGGGRKPLDYRKVFEGIAADKLQHLCADKGYDGKPAHQSIVDREYIPHVRRRGEEIEAKKIVPGYRARRWVVEVCHSWLNRFRKILVRYEKTLSSYIALLHLAAAIICWRKVGVIYG